MTLELPTDAGLILLPLARSAIAHRLGPTGQAPAVAVKRAAWLEEPGASFVTLTSGRLPGGPLRGCIGTLEAHRPLREDVEANAVAAATRDPRFPPLSRAELEDTIVEVSVLSAPAVLPAADEAELLARLRRKAGLPADYWGRDVVVQTYTVSAWQEAAPGVVPDGPRGRRP